MKNNQGILSPSNKSTAQYLTWFIVVIVPICTLLISIRLGNYAVDDAHITYRHARNLTRGLGFSLNPHDQVLSTTSPLHGLLLVAISSLGIGNYSHLAVLISAISMLLLELTVFVLIHSEESIPFNQWAGLTGLLFSSSQH